MADFYYKVLSGILPCDYFLHKWIKYIPKYKYKYFNVTENLKHMLYECIIKVNFVWNKMGEYFKIDIKGRILS